MTLKKIFPELCRSLFSENLATVNHDHLTHHPVPSSIIFHVSPSHSHTHAQILPFTLKGFNKKQLCLYMPYLQHHDFTP